MRGLEQARYRARRSFKRRIAEKETQNPAIIAKVGNGDGTVVVPGRLGWIYVRLHGDDNQLTEAKLGIPLDTGSLDDAWVRVKRASPRKTSYYAVQEFITSSTGDPAPPMSAHALDPDAGPHTGSLPEDDVAFDDGAGHDHGGAAGTGKKVSHPDLVDVTADLHHSESHAPAHKSGGAQPLDVKELVDSEGRLLTGPQKTDLTDGGTTVLHQHAGGATDSVLITLTNRTGGQRASGDVVVTDPDDNESFVGTTAIGYQGKVLVVGETIADLSGGLCWERGGPFDVKVTGAVSRNDGLRTSATIYRASAAPSITGGGVFAIALSPNISGDGTVKAVFLDAVGGGGGAGAGTIEVQEDDAKIADADTVNFEGGGGKVTDEGGGKVTVDITPGAGGGAWTLIEDVELAAPATTIDFQNIPDTYKHLAILCSLRSTRNALNDGLRLRFNNSAVGYDWLGYELCHPNALATVEGVNDTSINVTWMLPSGLAPAGSFGSSSMYIWDYADASKLPSVHCPAGMGRAQAAGGVFIGRNYGQWRTTAAVSRITLFPENGPNFLAGSRATLYGIS